MVSASFLKVDLSGVRLEVAIGGSSRTAREYDVSDTVDVLGRSDVV